jgi:hypothetical protein
MKKLLLFITIAICYVGVNAQRGNNGPNNNYQSSALLVNTFANNQFTVIVDNNYQYQSDRNGNANIDYVTPGNHTITVLEYRRNIFGGQRQKQTYNGTIYFKPGVEIYLSINAFGIALIDEKPLYANRNYNNDDNYNYQNGNGCKKNKHHKNKNKCSDNKNERRWDND